MKPINKKKRLLWGTLILVLFGLVYLFFHEPTYSGLAEEENHILLFAHRGFGGYQPDNALQSGTKAFQEGFDGIDVDGQMSSDGVPVIFHDLSLDRLTNGTGKVSSQPLAYLRTLDLGLKYSTSTEGYFVQTFEEFVKESKGKGILMVELKIPSLVNTGLEQKVVDIIKKHDQLSGVYLSSFNPIVLWRLKHLDSRVRTVFIFMDTNWNPSLMKEIKKEDLVNLPWALRQEFVRRAIRKIVNPDFLSVNHEVDPSTIDTLLAHGWPVFLWTPNTKEDLTRAFDRKPYGIISDEVYMMKEMRK